MRTPAKSHLSLLKTLSKNMRAGFPFTILHDRIIISTVKPIEFPLEGYIQLKRESAISVKEGRLLLTSSGLEQLSLELEHKDRPVSGKLPTVNSEESPLARLAKLKSKKGVPYFAIEEVTAGERLRLDFERGNLQPKISANLSASAGLNGKGNFATAADISDFALDARARVNNALRTLGPELSGVALDVCCFLKGLELVERERQWPSRSAKLMLKTALSTLARHYGFSVNSKKSSANIQGWGSDGFRPDM